MRFHVSLGECTSSGLRFRGFGFKVSRRPRGSTTEFAQESLFTHSTKNKERQERHDLYSTLFTA